MFVLILTAFTFTPHTNPQIITNTSMVTVEGFKTQQTCEAVAGGYNSGSINPGGTANVFFRALCVQIQ